MTSIAKLEKATCVATVSSHDVIHSATVVSPVKILRPRKRNLSAKAAESEPSGEAWAIFSHEFSLSAAGRLSRCRLSC